MRMKHAVDFKYYDYQTEDRTVDKDPRPLESLEDVINPGFDEYGTMLSHPLPPHIPRLLQKDRQIFESCAIAGSKLLWPHSDTTGMQRHLTAQYIMNKAGCTIKEASYIADSCVALEATAKMVDEFCRWAKAKGAKALIEYLWKFVIGVTDAEAPSDEIEPWEAEPVEAGELHGGLFGACGLCEDVPVEEIERPVKEGSWATMVGGKLTWVEDIQALTVKEVPELLEDGVNEEEPIGLASTISYHVFEDFNAEKKVPWLDRQPDWFILELNQIQDCKTLEVLNLLGKTIHADNDFNRDQAGVFWTAYNSRKHELEPQHLGISARGILKRIIQANGNLGWVGQWLYKVGSGETKVYPKPTDYEMSVIWKTFKRQKEVHITA